MSPAIKFENVSKQYRLGEVGTGTLSHDLHRAWARMRGKPDPFAKVGQVNDRTVAASPETRKRKAEDSSYVWALKDINFEVEQGEILGIIGRNGAGKSTLLKLLSRVTAPTTGSIKAKGRIASLLEVGTGFHPELTGRENVYLNGAILGMRRHEITKQLDEIVEFSGCAKYIDTPVKRYSSGMTVRLGFAVAAHLDCEILVVDEVLAVGDAEFQSKCIGKMQQIAAGRGKTVLFVSHNLGSIANLCTSCVLFENGKIREEGGTSKVIEDYLSLSERTKTATIASCRSAAYQITDRPVEFTAIDLVGHEFGVPYGSDLEFRIRLASKSTQKLSQVSIGGSIRSKSGEVVTTFFTRQCLEFREGEQVSAIVSVKNLPIVPGNYYGAFSIGCGNERDRRNDYDVVVGLPKFEIIPMPSNGSAFSHWYHSWGATCWSDQAECRRI